MPRIRRVRRNTIGPGLTMGQRWELVYGFRPARSKGFENPVEFEAAWRRYREKLTFSVGLFRRPDAFWWREGGGQVPDCIAGGNESEQNALLRLGLPLSDVEKRIIQEAGAVVK